MGIPISASAGVGFRKIACGPPFLTFSCRSRLSARALNPPSCPGGFAGVLSAQLVEHRRA